LNRKQYSPEMKMQIVKEALETGNASIVARRYDIASSLVARWVRCYKQYGTFHSQKEKSSAKSADPSHDYNKKITKENEQLKKLLGEKDLEIAILRDLLKKTNPHLPIK